MPARKTSSAQKLRSELKRLREHARELGETLQAIRSGQVDALVIHGSSGDQVFTLQGAEHPYRVLVESINEGAAMLDTRGIVLYANDRFAQIFGAPLHQVIGSPMEDRLSPAECSKLRSLIKQARGNSGSCELVLEDGEGRRHIVRLSVSPFRESDLELVCAVATDVTELIEATEARKKSERELQSLSGRLLRAQDDERRRIARDLHDVSGQTLVALRLNLSQLEAMSALQSDADAQKIFAECEELSSQLGQEMRTLSYLLHPPLLDETGLASPLRWYVDGFGRRTGIQVKVDIPPDLTRFPPDTELALFRVVQESLTNVHRYSGSATAQVRVHARKGQLQLEIEDQGQGIPEDILESNGASAPLGVGIQGMRERMRQLSGQLEIKANPLGGVKVVATIPLSQRLSEPCEPDPNLLAIGNESDAAKESSGPVKRILLADDHVMIRQGMRTILQNEENWAVCGEAVDGKEAVEKVLALDPDLVILDINMPVQNGLNALRQIRQVRPQIKVLVCTVNDSSLARLEIMAAGADAYVSKSNAPEELIRAVKSLFAAGGNRTSMANA